MLSGMLFATVAPDQAFAFAPPPPPAPTVVGSSAGAGAAVTGGFIGFVAL